MFKSAFGVWHFFVLACLTSCCLSYRISNTSFRSYSIVFARNKFMKDDTTMQSSKMIWSPIASSWRKKAKSKINSSLDRSFIERSVPFRRKEFKVTGSIIAAAAIATVSLFYKSLPAFAEVTTLADGSIDVARNGFLQAFSLVFVSEIGDKTFFIAGLLAAKTSRLISFVGSISALAAMTILSCLIGVAFHRVPAALTNGIPFDDYIAVIAFLYFGIVTLRDATQIPDDNSGMEAEAAEAEESVEKIGEGKSKASEPSVFSLIAQTFGLVFAAEFGDRSFITTIALSAAQNPVSVAGGAILAHVSATGIAVMSGALLSKYISERLIGYIGGVLFIVFAVTTAFGLF